MDLILWRHAEAEVAGPDQDDASRRLTSKGQKQAARVGAWLNRQLPDTCLILSSPATRCIQTADALERRYKCAEALAIGSTPEAILAAAGWPNRKTAVLVVGHQPLLGQVAALLIAQVRQEWSVRKGSVLWISQKNDPPHTPLLRAVVGPDLVGRLDA